jgi:SAM-dependent MidA family methyltransferase
MAAELLGELARRDALPDRYLILDVSADLRDRQRTTLAAAVPGMLDRVEWLDRLPDGFTGVMVANEVVDAMPVERFVVRGGAVHALGVTWELGRLQWSEAPAGVALTEAVRAIEAECGGWPDGYTSEVNLGLGGWLAALAASLSRGVLLFVDYGLPRRELYAAERRDGTLLCHFRHRFHDDPLARPGLQDVTAWVDFTAVAEAAAAAGLEVAGYTTQAHFLIGSGLGECIANVADLDVVSRVNLSRQAMLLTLPGEMGERFKAIALVKGYDSSLCGFTARDLRHTL